MSASATDVLWQQGSPALNKSRFAVLSPFIGIRGSLVTARNYGLERVAMPVVAPR
jgi:hypothetical protein